MKPYKKAEKIRLKGMQDRRRALTDEEKDQIREMYAKGDIGTRPLARMFNVSKSLIQIIVNPQTAKKRKEYVKENWKRLASMPGKRKKLTEAVRNWRNYKYRLYMSGNLKDEDK
jgi:DNA invertase Pin-like site-specific DNA recombinase